MAIGVGYAITISVKNLPPVVFDDSYETNMGIPININALINDFDQDSFPDGNITINTFDSTSLGGSTITRSGDKKTFTYTPKTNWFGNDMFTYNVTDGMASSNTGTVKVAVKCLPPKQEPKSLNLTESTSYTFDITKTNTAPGAITFNNGVPDRDVNVPAQNISIVTGSVVASPNITIDSVTDTVIKFTTSALPLGASAGISFINYEIQNSICGIKNTEKASVGGSINDSLIRIVQGFLGRTINENNVPKAFSKYPMYDTVTNDYPFKSEGWFIFCFDAYNVPDQYYISMISKPYQNSLGVWTTDSFFHGLIGPIGDDLDDAHDGNGRFIFWKPFGCDLNIWGKTDAGSSGYQIGCTQAYKPAITDVDDPDRYFTDPLTRPTNAEVLACLNDVGKAPFNNTVNDYSNMYTGTATPAFISII